MLLELASLAHIDDDYSSEERQLLRQISGMMTRMNRMLRRDQW